MKAMWMVLFMVLPLLGIAYVTWHLWVLVPLHNLWKLLIIGLGVASFALLFLSMARRFDTLPLWLAQGCYEVGTSSLFVLLYLVMLFLVLDVGRLCHIVPRAFLYNNMTSAVVLLALVTAVFVYGNLHYRHKVRVALDIPTEKALPHDYRVVMLTDLHLGYHNTRRELARWVDIINGEHPDLVLIAGDIIDGSIRPLLEECMAEEFHRLTAPVYACLGNHEYYAGTPEAQQFYRDAGIRLLSDSAAVVDSALVIIGRDDLTNRRRKSVKDLTRQLPHLGKGQGEGYTILLDHQPYHLEQAEQAAIDFQLSGHTHRGQVWPVSWVTDALYECSWGSHRRGNTRYYVSSGLGIWGGKYRIGTQSEYVVATIHSTARRHPADRRPHARLRQRRSPADGRRSADPHSLFCLMPPRTRTNARLAATGRKFLITHFLII